MARLLSLPQPPDAVFCYNDLLAIGAMRTILNRGLRVPDDIAVVGFDDIEESRYSFPSLTTISPDKHEIARLAVAHHSFRIITRSMSHPSGYRQLNGPFIC
jgi:LacI family transcriptional regulator, repressor for deo operon, udp, cdd, tsx, nupC, and nupG